VIERHETTARLSKVLIAGGFVFLSGLTAKDKSGDVRAQTVDILNQIDGYLKLAGTDKDHLVSANIWLADISSFPEMNAGWESWINPQALPARATVESKLAGKGSLVEIMAQAILP
jgi:enamine deaminase RidA (YjgF/YER057c/UK114 family)